VACWFTVRKPCLGIDASSGDMATVTAPTTQHVLSGRPAAAGIGLKSGKRRELLLASPSRRAPFSTSRLVARARFAVAKSHPSTEYLPSRPDRTAMPPEKTAAHSGDVSRDRIAVTRAPRAAHHVASVSPPVAERRKWAAGGGAEVPVAPTELFTGRPPPDLRPAAGDIPLSPAPTVPCLLRQQFAFSAPNCRRCRPLARALHTFHASEARTLRAALNCRILFGDELRTTVDNKSYPLFLWWGKIVGPYRVKKGLVEEFCRTSFLRTRIFLIYMYCFRTKVWVNPTRFLCNASSIRMNFRGKARLLETLICASRLIFFVIHVLYLINITSTKFATFFIHVGLQLKTNSEDICVSSCC
jgi:hypothetical protein